MRALSAHWQFWAACSALFAALTAIFGKIGVADIDSNLANLIRTGIVLALAAAIVLVTRGWQPLSGIAGKSWLFLVLSGLATGASWLCYYHALKMGPASGVAPLDKLSVVLVAIFAAAFLGERMGAGGWVGVALIAAGGAMVALAS